MKKIIILAETLLTLFASIETNSQSKLRSDSMSYDIKGNIVLLGIQHTGSLYEVNERGEFIDPSLINSSSGEYLCSIYPEIIKAAKGKRMAFMMESSVPLHMRYLDSTTIRALKFPWCLLGDTIVGCDTRPESVKVQTIIMMSFLSPLYSDGLDGNEKSFEEAFERPSTIDMGKLNPTSKPYFDTWSKITGMHNRVFENYILGMCRGMEEKGFFVVVICGAAHAVKIVAEDKKKDIGYAICIDPKYNRGMLREAKKLMILEYLSSK